ncbi:spermatogenesis-associated protein 31E1-like [Perognathus longimembris pacificus]|uniref:spermatogenesis-associated protein 31E1-like n=1 Tax=Perognathus longimembris pacificus TaxID=214514 RepID=UPI0020188521|nr:spermatogenesis-associated protein 31E1-like [Perognathus longimembris pacificus]
MVLSQVAVCNKDTLGKLVKGFGCLIIPTPNFELQLSSALTVEGAHWYLHLSSLLDKVTEVVQEKFGLIVEISCEEERTYQELEEEQQQESLTLFGHHYGMSCSYLCFPVSGDDKKMPLHQPIVLLLYQDRRRCRKQLEEIYDLVTLLTSYLGKLHETRSFYHLLGGDGLGEMLESKCAADHQSPRQPEEDAFANTVSPVVSPAASAACLQSLAAPLSPVLISSPDSPGLHTSQSVLQPPEPLIPLGGIVFQSPAHSSSPTPSSQPVAYPPSMADPILSLWCDSTTIPPESNPPNNCGLLSIPATNSEIQELMEIRISEKSTLKVCQEREKEGVHNVGNSLRNLLSSLNSEQHIATPQSTWNRKGKPEQLAGSQQLTLPRVFGKKLQHGCRQLFWGLPSLHSESLVQAAWIHTRSSSVQHLSFAFNYVCPAEPQPEDAPHISQAETLPQDMNQSELGTQTFAPVEDQVPTEPYLPCSFPNYPHSPSQDRGVPYTTLEQRKQPSILDEHQDLEMSCQQLKWRKNFASKLQTTGEALSQPTGKLPQVHEASQTYKLVTALSGDSISTYIQEHKEAVTRSEHQPGCSLRHTASQNLMQPPGRLTGNCQCQAAYKHDSLPQPSQTSAIPSKGNSSMQKIDLAMLALNVPSKGVRQDQERDLSEDQAWNSGSTLVKGWEAQLSKRDCMMRTKCQKQASADTSSHLPNSPNKKYVENILTFHLGRKLNQLKEGMIPVCVRQSHLTASHASPNSTVHAKPTNHSSHKCVPSIANTSQELSFLDPKTLLILETHIVRYRVRQKWDPQMQSSDPRTLALHANAALPLAQPAHSSPASFDSRVSSIVKVANTPEDLQEGLVDTLQGPFTVPQPTEQLKLQSRTLSGGIHGPSEAYPSGQMGSLDLQFPTYSFLHRTRKNRTLLETVQGSLEPSPNVAMAMHEPGEMSGSIALGDPCLSRTSPDIKGLSQLSVPETSDILQMEETPPSTGGASMVDNPQMIHTPNSSESPRTNKSHSPSSNFDLQEPIYTGLKSWVITEIQKQVKVKLEKHFQHQTASIFQHGHTDRLSTKVSLPSQASEFTSQNLTSNKISTPQIKGGLSERRGPSQPQQELKDSRIEVTGKNQKKIFSVSDERQGCRKLAPGLQEERRAVVRPCHTCGLSPLIQVNEQGAIARKTSPTSPQKAHISTENYVQKKMQNFLHFANPSTKDKRQEDSLPRVKCSSLPAQSRPFRDSGATKTKTLMMAVGKIMVDKLGLQHGSQELPKEPKTLLDRHLNCHTDPCYPQEKSMIENKSHGHQTIHKDPHYPINNKWAGGRDRYVQVPVSTANFYPSSLGGPCQSTVVSLNSCILTRDPGIQHCVVATVDDLQTPMDANQDEDVDSGSIWIIW